jgi:hypothetical protein
MTTKREFLSRLIAAVSLAPALARMGGKIEPEQGWTGHEYIGKTSKSELVIVRFDKDQFLKGYANAINGMERTGGA